MFGLRNHGRFALLFHCVALDTFNSSALTGIGGPFLFRFLRSVLGRICNRIRRPARCSSVRLCFLFIGFRWEKLDFRIGNFYAFRLGRVYPVENFADSRFRPFFLDVSFFLCLACQLSRRSTTGNKESQKEAKNSPYGRSPRADEVMAFGRRTVTMSFSGLRPIFAIGGSAGAVCGSYEPRGPAAPRRMGLRRAARTLWRSGGWSCGDGLRLLRAARAAASARGGPQLRCRSVRTLRRLRPTVANRRDRRLRPGFTASFPHFGCAAAAPARQNVSALAFAHDFS